jgi:hypothetical protein
MGRVPKHYSHLQVKEAKGQLRGEKVGALLRSLGNIDGLLAETASI